MPAYKSNNFGDSAGNITSAKPSPGALGWCAQSRTGLASGDSQAFTIALEGRTAPCAHQPKAPGDGFALVMFPAESPKLLLLVRGHAMPGSKAAGIAARMLAQIGELDANAK